MNAKETRGKITIHSAPSPLKPRRMGKEILFSGEYVQWGFSADGGQLNKAVVRNGSGDNLIREPLHSTITCLEDGIERNYTAGKTADKVELTNGVLTVVRRFVSDDGKVLPGFYMKHTMIPGEWGEVVHVMEFIPEKPVKKISAFRPAIFGICDDMKQLGIRARYACSGGYWTQHIMEWKELGGGRLYSDPQPYLSSHLPLSMLFLNPGIEAIQFELGDDLQSWDMQSGYQEGIILYNAETHSFQTRMGMFIGRTFNPVDFTRPLKIAFRMSLPFVKKNIVPLRRASSLLYLDRGFENCYPREEDLTAMKKAGYDLLRLHWDNDKFQNGIFWRDAVYPPFPPEEMVRMETMLEKAHRQGISVVPYFSVKEIHPVAPGYKRNSLKWARLSEPDYPLKVSKFGSVMCLKSDWAKMRKDTIRTVLKKHDFDGIYYDWVCGMECWNHRHSKAQHWDNDLLLEHLKWTVETFHKNQGERYEHFTNVSSLALENTATMIITEEKVFPAISPEMFSPHVHFVNIAPRQICEMLPVNAPDETRLRLAMAALLHHASISSIHPVYLKFYASQKWLDSVTAYTRHAAPGEGVIISNNAQVGFSVYWNESELLITAANFSGEVQTATCTIQISGQRYQRHLRVKPLSVKTLRMPR